MYKDLIHQIAEQLLRVLERRTRAQNGSVTLINIERFSKNNSEGSKNVTIIPHPSLEIEKEIRCVVFTSSKQCRINKFDQISRLCCAGRGGGGGARTAKKYTKRVLHVPNLSFGLLNL